MEKNMSIYVLLILTCFSVVVFAQTSPLTVENQIRLTGFTTITCDEERDAYTFRVNNGLAIAMNYRVDLVCDERDARNSLELAPLAPFSRTIDTLTIKPVRGTVRNQKCTLLLVGKDVYGVESSNTAQDIIYASQTRLCGRSLFDGAFDDDDDDCSYMTCISTRNWWHNGLIYWITYAAMLILGLIAILTVTGAKYSALNARFEAPSMIGSDPQNLLENITNNMETYMAKPFGNKYMAKLKEGVRDLSAYESFENVTEGMARAKGSGAFSEFHNELMNLADEVHPDTRENTIQLLRGPHLGKGRYVEAVEEMERTYGGDSFNSIPSSEITSFKDSEVLRAVGEDAMPSHSGVRNTIQAEAIDYGRLSIGGGDYSNSYIEDEESGENEHDGGQVFIPITEQIMVKPTYHTTGSSAAATSTNRSGTSNQSSHINDVSAAMAELGGDDITADGYM